VNDINNSGAAFLSPSKLDEKWMVRVSIGVESTTRSNVELLWKLMRQKVQG